MLPLPDPIFPPAGASADIVLIIIWCVSTAVVAAAMTRLAWRLVKARGPF
jgi:hypothetical protein